MLAYDSIVCNAFWVPVVVGFGPGYPRQADMAAGVLLDAMETTICINEKGPDRIGALRLLQFA